MKKNIIKIFFIVTICVSGLFVLSISTKAATIKSNTSKLTLNLMNKEASYHKIKLTVKGSDLPESYHIEVGHHKAKTLTSFSGWKGKKITLTVRANKTGYDLLEVVLIDDSTNDIVASYDIPVYIYSCWIETKHKVTVKKGQTKKIKIKIYGKKPKILTVGYYVKGKPKKGKYAKYIWGKPKGNTFYLKIKGRKKGKEKMILELFDKTTGGWVMDEAKVKVKVKR